ncbi:GvpL/GvpF family gas vesicle protein [Streptomyces iconiensis]|uniref:GvpL/GvpF family gas vesicle protein n=1 Tax=Streptomyces iconiensis TaxID=1384038 RepID=A0ABT6ZZ97_9ACTN|nr:GvpL/GvpF family gas vesicle protein [Streptomyces iconiensis]MDJ1134370.1 GvpL/GvpF family gas vesicle protein [Streptomyces iconiensis]
MKSDAELRYVYAVTAPFPTALAGDLRGVGDTVPRTLRHGDLVAVLSDVPGDDFGEEPLRAHLEDLDWVSATARAHQAVVDALTAVTCPLPLRLATLYRDDEGVRRALEAGHAEFTETLARLDGRVEWGVKVYAEQPAPQPAEPARPAPTSGRDYLRSRRRAVTARENVLEEAEQLGRALHAALSGYAEDIRIYPAQNPKLSRIPGQNLLNAAYLVPRDTSEDFVARLDQLAGHDPNIRVELTGPWAPYSFAAAERATESR